MTQSAAPDSTTPTHAVRKPRSAGFNVGVHGLRGVAATMVLVAHILGGTAEHIYPDRVGYVTGVAPYDQSGTYFVYLFFLISGFVIIPSAFRYRAQEFALRRFVRIYPLFFVCSMLFVIGNAMTNMEPSMNNPATILFGLTFTNMIFGTEQLTPNAWSLSYEATFYVLAALSAAAILRRNLVLGAVAGLASIAFLVSYPAAIYFVSGAVIYWMHKRESLRWLPFRRVAEVVLLVALIGVVSQAYESNDPKQVTEPLSLLTVAIMALYFLLAAERDSLTAWLLSARPLQYLGTISYSLYLVHPYFYLGLRVVFDRLNLFGDNITVSLLLFGAVVFAVALAAAHLSFLLLEKLPQTLIFKRDRSQVTKLGILRQIASDKLVKRKSGV